MKTFLLLLTLALAACNATTQRLAANAAADALAAGEGYLVAGKAGAIAYGMKQEAANVREWQRTAAKQPREVRP